MVKEDIPQVSEDLMRFLSSFVCDDDTTALILNDRRVKDIKEHLYNLRRNGERYVQMAHDFEAWLNRIGFHENPSIELRITQVK
jgi:hypothetical protein